LVSLIYADYWLINADFYQWSSAIISGHQ